MDHDVIVIGAGLGGLTAGARLAKAGKKVLLIEQHKIPGGCATTIPRKGVKLEMGLHMIDGLHREDPKVKLFEELGVTEEVEFVRLPEFFRVHRPGLDFVMPLGAEQIIAALSQRYPAEKKAIRKFFKIICNLHKEVLRIPRKKWLYVASMMLAPILYPNVMIRERMTAGQLVEDLFQDEELKLLLMMNLGFYHDDPFAVSILYFAGGQGSFYSGGAHFIKGGSQELSNCLASVIERGGGEILYRHLVDEIIIEDGAAAGVRYHKASDDDGERQIARARRVVANAAIPNVVDHMIGDRQAQARLSEAVGEPRIARSILQVNLVFDRPLRELGNRHFTSIIIDEGLTRQRDYAEYYRTDFSRRTFLFTDYAMIDSGLAPEGKGVGSISALDDISDWEGLSKDQYRARKEEVAQILIDRVDRMIPGAKDAIEHHEVSTPRTIQRYTLNPQGTAYGYSQEPSQAGRHRIKIRSPIKNLYFASAWTEPGHGFTGAMVSGNWCAEEILRS